jgi:hypothetical protein
MASELVTQLRHIRDKVNDLSIDDDKAKEFENLITKSIEIITKMNNPHDDFFESRRRGALRDLQSDFSRHLKGYWEGQSKIDKISEFSRARNNANLVLSHIITSFKNS